jgi:hypothetical protein
MATLTLTPKGSVEPAVSAPVEVVDDSSALVEASNNSVTVAAPVRVSSAGIEGEVTTADINTPRVNLVQKSGQLADSFAPGTFLLVKEIVLAKPNQSFKFTPLRLKKYYQLKVEFGSSQDIPPKFNTMQEVIDFGGSLTYGDDKYCVEMADILMAVHAPEDCDDQLFPYRDENDNAYALALYTVGSSSYTSLAKRIITDSVGLLRNGLYTGYYEVHSEIRKNATNSWYVPVAKFVEKHKDPEFFKNIAGL